jgi:hypothetical protein
MSETAAIIVALLCLLLYVVLKVWGWALSTRCPECQEWFTVEVADERVRNKQRKFRGYALTYVNGKTRTRQRRVTTEHIRQHCVCSACGHEFERDTEQSYES